MGFDIGATMTNEAVLAIVFGFCAVAVVMLSAVVWRCVERMRERANDH